MMSLLGVLYSILSSLFSKVHLDVLIYRTTIEPLVLRIYVVPQDVSVIQAVKNEMEECAPNARRIVKNVPRNPVRLSSRISLEASAPDIKISPPDFTLELTEPPHLPHFFKVNIGNAESSFDLVLVNEGRPIWKTTLYMGCQCLSRRCYEEGQDTGSQPRERPYGEKEVSPIPDIRGDAEELNYEISEGTPWLQRESPNGEKEVAPLQDIVGDAVEVVDAIRKVRAWLQLEEDEKNSGIYDTHASDKVSEHNTFVSMRSESRVKSTISSTSIVPWGPDEDRDDFSEVSSFHSRDMIFEAPSAQDLGVSGPQSTVEPPMKEEENQDPGLLGALMPTQEETDCLDSSTGASPSLYDRPSNCCKSCEDIEDSSDWTPMTPAVCMATGVLVYTHSSPPGSFECTVSSLRWVCEKNVTLQYHFGEPDIFREKLAMLQYTPIGPLMEIKVLSGELVEAHLPHVACLDGSGASLNEAVKILHAVDGVVHLETCELTRFHAKLMHPSFSDIQVLVKDGELKKIHLDVLIYQTRVEPLFLLTYVVPRDASMIEVVEKDIKKDVPHAIKIKKPRPGISLQPHSSCSLEATCEAIISPENCEVRYISPPDFFEVIIGKVESSFHLEIKSDGQSIWKATLCKHEMKDKMIDGEEAKSTTNDQEGKMGTQSTKAAGVGVNAKAHSGGLTNIPVLNSCSFDGPVNFVCGPSSQGLVNVLLWIAVLLLPVVITALAAAGYSEEGIHNEVTKTTTAARTTQEEGKLSLMSNKECLSQIRPDLIKRISRGVLRTLLDDLQAYSPPVVCSTEAEEILQSSSVLQDQVTSLIDALLNKGEKACGIMFSLLRELDSYLYEDLDL